MQGKVFFFLFSDMDSKSGTLGELLGYYQSLYFQQDTEKNLFLCQNRGLKSSFGGFQPERTTVDFPQHTQSTYTAPNLKSGHSFCYWQKQQPSKGFRTPRLVQRKKKGSEKLNSVGKKVLIPKQLIWFKLTDLSYKQLTGLKTTQDSNQVLYFSTILYLHIQHMCTHMQESIPHIQCKPNFQVQFRFYRIRQKTASKFI